jgi:hypothetical protein
VELPDLIRATAICPPVLAENDEAVVERHVGERGQAEEPLVLLLVRVPARRQRLPFECERGIHEDVPPDHLADDAIELGRLHPLVERRVLVSRFEVHPANRFFRARTRRRSERNAFHVLDAADAPANGVAHVPRMGDDPQPGVLGRARQRGKQLTVEALIQLETVDARRLQARNDGRCIFRGMNRVEAAAVDGRALFCLLGRQADFTAEEVARPAHPSGVEAMPECGLVVIRVAQVVDGGHAVRQEELTFPVAVVHVRIDEARENELAARVDALDAGSGDR